MADTTIDGHEVKEGLEVYDYNLDHGKVAGVDHVDNVGTTWYKIELDNGGRSMMDAKRLWVRMPRF